MTLEDRLFVVGDKCNDKKICIMKVNELRVGNLVCYDEGFFSKVTGIKPIGEQVLIDIYHDDNEVSKGWMLEVGDLKPIPLTEELLLRCGFKSVSNDAMIHKLNRHFRLEYALGEYVLRIKTDRHDSSYIRVVRSLHQLQNLYFAIIGEELEVKLQDK